MMQNKTMQNHNTKKQNANQHNANQHNANQHNANLTRFEKASISEPMRLNKYLSDAGVCSRREADRMIEAGRVMVNGQVAECGLKVLPTDEVLVDNKKISREEEMILLAFHKPRGIVCTTDKRWGDETIYDVLQYPKRVFSIGRLDKESEGLLLLTNNGDILNKMMRESNYHEKEYLVTVDGMVDEQFLEKMRGGIYLKELDRTTRPCTVEKTGAHSFRIILTQGLNRQIRRMCEACNRKVTKLKRIRVMNITLGNLTAGTYRSVSAEEWKQLQLLIEGSV